MNKIKQFIVDDRGIGENVFQLALIVIIVAAVLAVLAYVLSTVWTASEDLGGATEDSGQDAAKQACEMRGGTWTNGTGNTTGTCT